MPYYNRDPKRDHNFDNHPSGFWVQGLGFEGLRDLRFKISACAVYSLKGLWDSGFMLQRFGV